MTVAVPTTTYPVATDQPQVTVLICTRDRGESIQATIRSVLANTYAHFDLLIVDQSSELRTAHAVAQFRDDPRLRYIYTNSRGKSWAMNLGLRLISAELVLMTDDDCEVPPDWVAEMAAPFLRYPQLGIAFCDVVAGPHDPNAGLIPVSVSRRALLIEDMAHWQTCDGVNIGIGAGIALRRSAAATVGGFDVRFGPGGHFRNGEDLDFTLRVLAAGYQIYRLNHVGVVHHGFRTFQQNRSLMRSNMFSVGAAYSRIIRHGHWRAIRYYLAMVIAMVLVPIIESLLRLRVPPVLGRVVWLARGTIAGLRLRPAPPPRGFMGIDQA